MGLNGLLHRLSISLSLDLGLSFGSLSISCLLSLFTNLVSNFLRGIKSLELWNWVGLLLGFSSSCLSLILLAWLLITVLLGLLLWGLGLWKSLLFLLFLLDGSLSLLFKLLSGLLPLLLKLFTVSFLAIPVIHVFLIFCNARPVEIINDCAILLSELGFTGSCTLISISVSQKLL